MNSTVLLHATTVTAGLQCTRFMWENFQKESGFASIGLAGSAPFNPFTNPINDHRTFLPLTDRIQDVLFYQMLIGYVAHIVYLNMIRYVIWTINKTIFLKELRIFYLVNILNILVIYLFYYSQRFYFKIDINLLYVHYSFFAKNFIRFDPPELF